MRCFFIGVLLVIGHIPLQAQQPVTDSIDKIFTKIPLTAEFRGGEAAWIRFLMKNLHVPAGSINNEFSGRAVVRFVVSQTGKISQVEVISKADSAWAREIRRVINLSDGMWSPAYACGRVVKSYKTLPIQVCLEQ